MAHPLEPRFLQFSAYHPPLRAIWRRWVESDQDVLGKLLAVFTAGATPQDRARTARVLGYLCDQRATPALLAAATDPNDMVRLSATAALVALGDESVIAQLADDLPNVSHNLRMKLVVLIGPAGESAVPGLLALLKHPAPLMDRAAIIGLGHTASRKAVQALLTHPVIVTYDYDYTTEFHLFGALNRLGAVAPDLLIEAASASDPALRSRALRMLSQQRPATAALPLLALLKDTPAQNPGERYWVLTALVRLITPQNAGLYRQMLEEPDAYVRLAAAEALNALGEQEAVETFLALLHEQDHFIRLRAVGAVGQLRERRAVEPLIQALADREGSVRSAAAKALGSLGDRQAVKPLIQALTDPDIRVRSAAAEALGSLGDRRAVGPLSQALTDPDASMRWTTVKALSKLGDPQAIEPLKKALSASDLGFRSTVDYALGVLAGENLADLYLGMLQEMGSSTPDIVINTLGRLKDRRAIEPLIALLKDPVIKVVDRWSERAATKEAIIWAAGELGDPRVVEPLVELLPPNTLPEGVLLGYPPDGIIYALGKIRTARALEALLACATSPHSAIRLVAAYPLSQSTNTRALEALQQAHQERPEDVMIAWAFSSVSSQIQRRKDMQHRTIKRRPVSKEFLLS